MSLHLLLRRLTLSLAQNPVVASVVRRYGMRLGAGRFVAGNTLDECVVVLRRLNQHGLLTNTTLLGESVRDAATTRQVAETYLSVLDRIQAEGLRTYVSVKLTHLGLDISEDIAYEHVRHLVAHAASGGNFVRMDMEDYPRVDATLRIYRRLRDDGFTNVGTVLQSYLYRSEADLGALLTLRPNLRIVKGAYLEPPEVAYPRKADVDRNFVRLAEMMLLEGGYTAIATHDQQIITHCIGFTEAHRIPRDRFEFQMLYGVRQQLQLDLARGGFVVRVATPYGPDWYPYLMRRLAERPANVLFMVRNLLRA
jgi:proline dehydrogenase